MQASTSGWSCDQERAKEEEESGVGWVATAQRWKAQCTELQAQIANLTEQNAADKHELQVKSLMRPR